LSHPISRDIFEIAHFFSLAVVSVAEAAFVPFPVNPSQVLLCASELGVWLQLGDVDGPFTDGENERRTMCPAANLNTNDFDEVRASQRSIP
jgi:hypothetical protein